MGMVITDMIIVGRLGSDELAAVGLAGDLFYILLLIGMGVISIVGVIAAQNFGAGELETMRAASDQGMIAATVTSLPIIAGVWYLGPILSLASQDPIVVALITDYARALTPAVLPALWFVVLRNYITALARSAAIGWITAGAVLLNLALNYTLVFGVFGLPALGVVGAGIGTTIVNWIMFASMVLYVRRAPHLEACRPRLLPRRLDRAMLRDLFSLGLPVALTQTLNGGMFSTAAILVGTLGAATLAAQQIVYSVLYLAMSFAGGFADAVRVRVAYFIGRAEPPAARQSARTAVSLAAISTAVACLILWLFPERLVGIFLTQDDVDNLEVLAIAVSLSAAAGVFLFFDCIQMVLANALRGLRDTRSPLWIALVGYWAVGLGCGASLAFGLNYGAIGLWWGLAGGVVLCNALLMSKLRQRFNDALHLREPAGTMA